MNGYLLVGTSAVVAAIVSATACSSGAPFGSGAELGGAGGDDTSQAGHTDQPGSGAAGTGSGGTGTGNGGMGTGSGGTGTSGGGVGDGGNASGAGGGDPTTQGGQVASDGGADSGATTCAQPCQDPTPFCAILNGTPTCTNPAQALSGKRIELPCVAGEDSVAALCPTIADRATQCPAGGKVSKQTLQIGGDPGTLYTVTLQIRGVLEPRSYVGGKDAGNHFYVGGTGQQPSNYNSYSIVVSSPAQTFYLNSDTKAESYRVFTLDHEKAIVVAGGASVTLQVTDPDCAMVRNCQSPEASTCTPYVVTGVPPAPKAFNGQFVQLDVLHVRVSE